MLPERLTDAIRLNEIVNHPAVRLDIANAGAGTLDLSSIAANEKNYILSGEHGCIILGYMMDCVYEAHSQILPSGRGTWTHEFIMACIEYMFTRTDALELITRVPHGHIGAKAATKLSGFHYEFTRHDQCRFREKDVGVDIYSLCLQDWMPNAPGMEEFGRQFHARLHSEADRLGITAPAHADDPNHNQYIGTCVKMMLAGQAYKAAAFYNRWAQASRHPTVGIVSLDPVMVKFDIGTLKVNGADLEDIEVCL